MARTARPPSVGRRRRPDGPCRPGRPDTVNAPRKGTPPRLPRRHTAGQTRPTRPSGRVSGGLTPSGPARLGHAGGGPSIPRRRPAGRAVSQTVGPRRRVTPRVGLLPASAAATTVVAPRGAGERPATRVTRPTTGVRHRRLGLRPFCLETVVDTAMPEGLLPTAPDGVLAATGLILDFTSLQRSDVTYLTLFTLSYTSDVDALLYALHIGRPGPDTGLTGTIVAVEVRPLVVAEGGPRP